MNRRDFINGLGTFAAVAMLNHSRVGAQGPPHRKTLRVYHIGNSVTDTINYAALQEMARSRGYRHIWGRHTIPGAPLSWIWEHPGDGFQQEPFGYYPEALANYQWDAITLQPFDRLLDGDEGQDLPTAKRFMDLALRKSPDAQFYIYSRWPRREEPTEGTYTLNYAARWNRPYTGGWDGTRETRDYFEKLTRALRNAYPDLRKPIQVVPVGDVLLELDTRIKAGKIPGYKDISAVYYDGIHVNNVGSFIVGTTFFATLYKEDPRGLPFEPYNTLKHEYDTPLGEALAHAIQDAAWMIVRAHPLSGVQKHLEDR